MIEDVAFDFKKTFRKLNEKHTANKSNNICTRCGGKPHSNRHCPAPNKKVGHFSKLCRSKPQSNLVRYNKQNNFCEEEKIASQQASQAAEMGLFHTNEQFVGMSVTWKNIAINTAK